MAELRKIEPQFDDSEDSLGELRSYLQEKMEKVDIKYDITEDKLDQLIKSFNLRYLQDHPEYVGAGMAPPQFSFKIPRPLQENYVRNCPAPPPRLSGP